MSGEENQGQGVDGKEEEEAAKMTRHPGALIAPQVARHAVSHWLHRSWCAHCIRKRGSGGGITKEKHANTEPRQCRVRSSGSLDERRRRWTPRHEKCSHTCGKRTRADPDILEALMEDIEVFGQRQIVTESDQENPAKAVRECGTKSTDDVGKPSVSLH